MFGIFGKKKGPSDPTPPNASTSGPADLKSVSQYPWQPQSNITGNLAIANLRNNLLERLKTEKGVHAETLCTAIGVLVGFAAQNAALCQAAEMLCLIEDLGKNEDLPQFSVVQVEVPGEKYLVGNWINLFLFNDPGSSNFTLYKLIGGRTIGLTGVPVKDLPDFHEMAKHVIETMGTADFGRLRAPNGHHPALQPVDLLKMLWPFVCKILSLPLQEQIPSAPPDTEPPLLEIHWPVVASLVASLIIELAKDSLNPLISYKLIMESAIIGAKVNPELIEPGKWKIEANAGKMKVKRLKG